MENNLHHAAVKLSEARELLLGSDPNVREGTKGYIHIVRAIEHTETAILYANEAMAGPGEGVL